MNVQAYWNATLRQNPDALRRFFHKEAFVNWHNTNERFTVDEFIRANCEYPGQWDGRIERIVEADELVIVAVRVFSRTQNASFHVTSFIRVMDGKIASIDEYWGDDTSAPQWRLDKHIGRPIPKSDADCNG